VRKTEEEATHPMEGCPLAAMGCVGCFQGIEESVLLSMAMGVFLNSKILNLTRSDKLAL
jgi:hypothetical protein